MPQKERQTHDTDTDRSPRDRDLKSASTGADHVEATASSSAIPDVIDAVIPSPRSFFCHAALERLSASGGDPVKIVDDQNRPVAALITLADLALFKQLEMAQDIRAYDTAKARDESTLTVDEIRTELGLA